MNFLGNFSRDFFYLRFAQTSRYINEDCWIQTTTCVRYHFSDANIDLSQFNATDTISRSHDVNTKMCNFMNNVAVIVAVFHSSKFFVVRMSLSFETIMERSGSILVARHNCKIQIITGHSQQ